MLNREQFQQLFNTIDTSGGSHDLMYRLPDTLREQAFAPAAVLVPLVEHRDAAIDEYQVLLTRRAKHLKKHAGQISFPGGRVEPNDPSIEAAALRETEEEIGISSFYIDIIGTLPKHQTITHYEMTPVVGLVSPDYQLTLDRNEVDEAFEVPLQFICDESNHQLKDAEFRGEHHQYYLIQYQEYSIWGATARVLVEFARLINRFDH